MNGMNAFRNYCCLVVLCFLVLDVSAQEKAPVSLYLQTENNHPFEVKWNGKNFASSSSGYMVLPQVTAGTQSLAIVFRGSEKAEYTFTLTTSGEAKGYTLRQAVDNSWSLFDMVEWAVVKGVYTEPVAKTVIALNPLGQGAATFGEDQAIVKIPVKFVETPPVKTAPPVVMKPREPLITGILKIFDKSGTTGVDQVYVLTNGSRSDTIALFIPSLNEEIPKTGTNPAATIYKHFQSGDVVPTGIEALLIRKRYPLLSK